MEGWVRVAVTVPVMVPVVVLFAFALKASSEDVNLAGVKG